MTRLALAVSLVLLCAGETAAGLADGSTLLLEDHVYESRAFSGAQLVIYCNPGESPSYLALFKSLYIEFRLVPEHYSLFEGADADEVRSQHTSRLASWMPLLPWRQSTIGFPTFRPHCVGLVSDDEFRFEFVVRQANYWKIFQLCLGVVLFFTVPSLCRNVLVFYTAGVTFGVVASLLLVVFILSRLLPRRSTAYGVLFFGWSLVLYVLQLLWSNLYDVLEQYKHLLAGYVAVSALVSFGVCYRLGPPSHPRTLDLLQWSLQLLSLGLVFLSSSYGRTHWKRRFPPEVKLLTEDEYLQQADVETRKELARLARVCASPDCKTWTLVTKLKDPVRFALFVQDSRIWQTLKCCSTNWTLQTTQQRWMR
ncbi:hypothetical protein HPB47_021934 [Ixodes persulcatus]|uniref:Uncharacterized protein n=1 Tax=Ixodes persulcatus TaxID=34615 RepID=A0AC60QBH2_IXOPE|nr:hypothetical protein HPB47_021934 [Ixodes persulcatus]